MLEILEHFQFLYDGAAFFFSAEGWKTCHDPDRRAADLSGSGQRL